MLEACRSELVARGHGALAPEHPRHGPTELWTAASTEPQSIDPALCNDSVGSEVILNIFAALVELDPATLKPVPDLAERWHVSEDGLTYTFYMRSALWSDGVPLTAADVVFALRRVLEPATGCRFAPMLYVIAGAQAVHEGREADALQVRAMGPHTVRFTLREPTPYFLQFLAHSAFRPVPEHLLHALAQAPEGTERWTDPKHLVVSGPYTIARWRFKRDYTLQKNPAYYDREHVALERIWVRMVPSLGTAVNLFRTGALDWTGQSHSLPGSYVTHLSGYPEYYTEPMLSTSYLWLNTQDGPLKDPRARRALGLAIDREAITRYVLRGGQVPHADLVPGGLVGYPPVDAPLYDPNQARALWAQAGFDAAHPRPKLTLLYNTAESNRLVAEALQAMWRRELGVAVTLQSEEWRVFLDHVAGGKFQIARLGWVGDYADARSFLADVLGSEAGNNISGWRDPQFEALLQQSQQTQDPNARMALLHAAEALALEAAPLLPLYSGAQSGLMRRDIAGFVPQLLGHHAYKSLSFRPVQP